MDKRDGKKQYKQTFEFVKSLVLKEDWCGLGEDTPSDEYDDEIARIVALLGRKPGVDELAAGIKEIYKSSFGRDVSEQHFVGLATELLRRSEP